MENKLGLSDPTPTKKVTIYPINWLWNLLIYGCSIYFFNWYVIIPLLLIQFTRLKLKDQTTT